MRIFAVMSDQTAAERALWKENFFIESCLGKAMVAYTKPQQRKKEESEKLRGERNQIKFIDLRFDRRQVVRFRKATRQDVPKIACSRDE